MTVRRAVPADAAALAEVAAATFALACPPTTDAGGDRRLHRDRAVGGGVRRATSPTRARILLVAEEAPGAPFVGYTMLVAGEPADPDVAGAIRIRPDRRAVEDLRPRGLARPRDRRGAAGTESSTPRASAGARGHVARHERGERAGAALLREARLRASSARKRFKLGDRLRGRPRVRARALTGSGSADRAQDARPTRPRRDRSSVSVPASASHALGQARQRGREHGLDRHRRAARAPGSASTADAGGGVAVPRRTRASRRR